MQNKADVLTKMSILLGTIDFRSLTQQPKHPKEQEPRQPSNTPINLFIKRTVVKFLPITLWCWFHKSQSAIQLSIKI